MTAPGWIEAVVRDFGRGAGIDGLVLNARGAAAFRFENGISLRFEYHDGELAVVVSVPAANDAATMQRILGYAHPDARFGVAMTIRAGYLAKTRCAVFAIRLAAQDVTLPILDSVFGALWRVATEFGGIA